MMSVFSGIPSLASVSLMTEVISLMVDIFSFCLDDDTMRVLDEPLRDAQDFYGVDETSSPKNNDEWLGVDGLSEDDYSADIDGTDNYPYDDIPYLHNDVGGDLLL